MRRSELVLWHLSLPVVLQQAFLFKFGDVNKAVSVSFELEFWIFTLNIKMLPFGHVFSESLLVTTVYGYPSLLSVSRFVPF
jgi:hypothetical protein